MAIEKLHELAIVHRDVKLENVVLDESKMQQEGAFHFYSIYCISGRINCIGFDASLLAIHSDLFR